MHWRSVRPEMVTIGTNRFPHFGQRVVRSMRSSRFFLPMAHWFHGGAGPNSPFSFHRNEACFGAIQASGHRTLNNVPLDPFAFWAGKRSHVLAQRARLNRRQPHWRTASRALRALVLCVEHGCPSVRSPEFPGEPPYGSRFHGIARDDFVLYGVALRAFEPAMLKAHGTRTNAREHHARRAARTARALNWSERRAEGKISLWHDTSLHLGGSVQHSQSPIGADAGAVMEPACASEFRSHWSILLTFQN